MSKTIAYLRASTDKQDVKNQRLEILEWAGTIEMKIDTFVEITISSRKTSQQRRIDEVLHLLQEADILVVTELSRLGRSTAEVIALINTLVEKNVRVIILKQHLDISQHDMNSKIMITLFSLFAELERDLISSRTKEPLPPKSGKASRWASPKGRSRKVSLMPTCRGSRNCSRSDSLFVRLPSCWVIRTTWRSIPMSTNANFANHSSSEMVEAS